MIENTDGNWFVAEGFTSAESIMQMIGRRIICVLADKPANSADKQTLVALCGLSDDEEYSALSRADAHLFALSKVLLHAARGVVDGKRDAVQELQRVVEAIDNEASHG